MAAGHRVDSLEHGQSPHRFSAMSARPSLTTFSLMLGRQRAVHRLAGGLLRRAHRASMAGSGAVRTSRRRRRSRPRAWPGRCRRATLEAEDAVLARAPRAWRSPSSALPKSLGTSHTLLASPSRDLRQGLQVLVGKQFRGRLAGLDCARRPSRWPWPGPAPAGSGGPLTLGAQDAGLPFTLGLEDRGLLGALGGEDLRLLVALGRLDRRLPVALGGEDRGALLAVGLHLLLHRLLDGRRRVDA